MMDSNQKTKVPNTPNIVKKVLGGSGCSISGLISKEDGFLLFRFLTRLYKFTR